MSQKLHLSPLRHEEGDDPDDIKIVVMTRDGQSPSWLRLMFHATATGIMMKVIKQSAVEIVISENTTIPDVSQGHVVLLSQEMVNAQRKLMNDSGISIECAGGCGMWFDGDSLDNNGECPSCGREEEDE